MRFRKNWLAFLLTLSFGLILAGCGQPSVTQVVRQLQTVQSQLTSYKSTAMMTVHVQGTVERYFVETWYQSPNQYRIALGNENHEISQIILRNDRGIFILSPGAKKMIRFQGDWAERQGQLYLYNALLARIVAANQPAYSTREKIVSFEMGAESINPLISTQKVELTAGTFAPVQVTLFDKQKQPLITMTYLTFHQGVSFPANAFSADQMTSWQPIELPVSAPVQEFAIVEPGYVPGTDAVMSESETAGVVMVRYDGSAPFTLVEAHPTVSTDLGNGQMLTVEGVPAVLVEDGHVSQLYWLHDGIEFQLTSRMAIEKMVQVASSTFGDLGKS